MRKGFFVQRWDRHEETEQDKARANGGSADPQVFFEESSSRFHFPSPILRADLRCWIQQYIDEYAQNEARCTEVVLGCCGVWWLTFAYFTRHHAVTIKNIENAIGFVVLEEVDFKHKVYGEMLQASLQECTTPNPYIQKPAMQTRSKQTWINILEPLDFKFKIGQLFSFVIVGQR